MAWFCVLILWPIYLNEPLTEPSDPFTTPSPSHSRFVYIQDLWAYVAPWLLGVAIPLSDMGYLSGSSRRMACGSTPAGPAASRKRLSARERAHGRHPHRHCVLIQQGTEQARPHALRGRRAAGGSKRSRASAGRWLRTASAAPRPRLGTARATAATADAARAVSAAQ